MEFDVELILLILRHRVQKRKDRHLLSALLACLVGQELITIGWFPLVRQNDHWHVSPQKYVLHHGESKKESHQKPMHRKAPHQLVEFPVNH